MESIFLVVLIALAFPANASTVCSINAFSSYGVSRSVVLTKQGFFDSNEEFAIKLYTTQPGKSPSSEDVAAGHVQPLTKSLIDIEGNASVFGVKFAVQISGLEATMYGICSED